MLILSTCFWQGLRTAVAKEAQALVVVRVRVMSHVRPDLATVDGCHVGL